MYIHFLQTPGPDRKCYARPYCVFLFFKVKAALRTVVPAEQKYIEEEPKVSKQVCISISC